jgi:excisionase family DNA binding protein
MTTNETVEPLALNVGEAARASRLGESTIRAMIASGELRSIRVGDRRLVRIEDLRAFLAARAA